MELQADSNHFMLEPVKAEDMAKEIRQEQRAQAVHEAMGLGFLSPSPNRNRRKQYGRPNAKVIPNAINTTYLCHLGCF